MQLLPPVKAQDLCHYEDYTAYFYCVVHEADPLRTHVQIRDNVSVIEFTTYATQAADQLSPRSSSS